MITLKKEIEQEICRILPEIRKQVLSEFEEWNEYISRFEFHFDEALLMTLPYAVYEYLILHKGIKPDHINKSFVIYLLNEGELRGEELAQVVAHGLRRIASSHNSTTLFNAMKEAKTTMN